MGKKSQIACKPRTPRHLMRSTTALNQAPAAPQPNSSPSVKATTEHITKGQGIVKPSKHSLKLATEDEKNVRTRIEIKKRPVCNKNCCLHLFSLRKEPDGEEKIQVSFCRTSSLDYDN